MARNIAIQLAYRAGDIRDCLASTPCSVSRDTGICGIDTIATFYGRAES